MKSGERERTYSCLEIVHCTCALVVHVKIWAERNPLLLGPLSFLITPHFFPADPQFVLPQIGRPRSTNITCNGVLQLLVNKFSIFYVTLMYITVFTSTCDSFNFINQIHEIHSLKTLFYLKTYFNIIFLIYVLKFRVVLTFGVSN